MGRPGQGQRGLRSLPPGINLYGQDCAYYPQTRAAIHLHGGRTPWISDGTPHQWILPLDDYNDPNNPYKQGVSLYNVPDMPVPAAANETTYYWSNQQSARLMFYHDHAWGITRLNVLAGEAAGLVITDPTEQTLMAEGVLPGYGIPLVIQDRTFVNAAINPLTGESFVRDTDPTWNAGTGTPDATGVRPPVDGDFWIPHVYVPAQNPFTPSGVNAFGRWVYGPWFFPPTANLIYPPVANPYHDANCSDPDPAVLAFCTTPNQPPVIPGTPTPSVGAETFFDTAMVNGQAFPVLDVYEQTYRFRILNAANDRFQNLNIYKADPLQVTHPHWNALPVAQNTEVEMCAVPGGVPPLDTLHSVCWDQATFPNWPNDGRVEGVPNPNKLGPNIVYIGTEGGFLPKPVVLKGQPITFVTDPTAFNVGNVKDFNLFLGPAERADVLIDFTGWGGQDLILYNDAPAAVPAFDPRFDYITGAPDLSANGGYGRVPPWNEATPGAALEGPQIGYGPNTRTVMKIRVLSGTDPTNPGGPLNLTALNARWAPAAGRVSVFEASQDPIIVGQADYDGVYASNPTFPSVWPAWGISRIEDNSLMFETVGGTIVTFPMEPKAMHDEMGASFDKEYARMSTNLGTQLNPPKTNAANMTPFMYTDPATEFMNAALEPISPVLGDGTQLWKISHNGVDMHPIHFHIFDVQVINRVGWDGQIRLPAPQELGWKDTVRIAPLEDTIVAMRPWTPPMPFSIPFSWRVLNPAIPVGSGYGFTNIDPITQAPLVPPTTNILTSFAWEYVWHCHILSHEENDMMRPIVLNVVSTIPPTFAAAPTLGAFNAGYDVTWVDPTPVVYTEADFQNPLVSTGFGNAASEIGFRVRRNTNLLAPDPLLNSTWVEVCTARANKTTCKDTTAVNGTYYVYKVQAFNEAGITDSPLAQTAVQTSTITRVALTQAPTATTWTKNNTTTNVPVYTATAQTGAGTVASPYVNAQAEYRFTSTTGGVTTIVRDWAASNTWTMPLNTAGTTGGISYQINALARNATGGTPATSATPTRATPTSALVATTKTILVRITTPATAVSFTTISPVSPQTFGLSSLFTATATGGTWTSATNQNKQFQFSTSADAGLTWTVVSPWALGTRVGNDHHHSPLVDDAGHAAPGDLPRQGGRSHQRRRCRSDGIDDLRGPEHRGLGCDARPGAWHPEPWSRTGGLPRHGLGGGALDRDGRRVLLPLPGRRSGAAGVGHEPRLHAAGLHGGWHLQGDRGGEDQHVRCSTGLHVHRLRGAQRRDGQLHVLLADGEPGYLRDAGDDHRDWRGRPHGLRLPVPVHPGRRHAVRLEHDQHVRAGRDHCRRCPHAGRRGLHVADSGHSGEHGEHDVPDQLPGGDGPDHRRRCADQPAGLRDGGHLHGGWQQHAGAARGGVQVPVQGRCGWHVQRLEHDTYIRDGRDDAGGQPHRHCRGDDRQQPGGRDGR